MNLISLGFIALILLIQTALNSDLLYAARAPAKAGAGASSESKAVLPPAGDAVPARIDEFKLIKHIEIEGHMVASVAIGENIFLTDGYILSAIHLEHLTLKQFLAEEGLLVRGMPPQILKADDKVVVVKQDTLHVFDSKDPSLSPQIFEEMSSFDGFDSRSPIVFGDKLIWTYDTKLISFDMSKAGALPQEFYISKNYMGALNVTSNELVATDCSPAGNALLIFDKDLKLHQRIPISMSVKKIAIGDRKLLAFGNSDRSGSINSVLIFDRHNLSSSPTLLSLPKLQRLSFVSHVSIFERYFMVVDSMGNVFVGDLEDSKTLVQSVKLSKPQVKRGARYDDAIEPLIVGDFLFVNNASGIEMIELKNSSQAQILTHTGAFRYSIEDAVFAGNRLFIKRQDDSKTYLSVFEVPSFVLRSTLSPSSTADDVKSEERKTPSVVAPPSAASPGAAASCVVDKSKWNCPCCEAENKGIDSQCYACLTAKP
jgi:hypothetical protein